MKIKNTAGIIISAAFAVCAQNVSAQNGTWQLGGDGWYTNASNWTSGTIPGTGGSATIRQDGTYTVRLATPVTNAQMYLDPATPLGANIRNVTLDYSGGGYHTLSGRMYVSNMDVTLTGGTLDVSQGGNHNIKLLGANSSADSGATFTIGTGGELVTRAGYIVALSHYGSDNQITIRDGGKWTHMSTTAPRLGDNGGANTNTLLVTGAGSKATLGGFASGYAGRGNRTLVEDGGEMAVTDRLRVGISGSNDSEVRVSGSNTVANVRSKLQAGNIYTGGAGSVVAITDKAHAVVTGNVESRIGEDTAAVENRFIVSDSVFEITGANIFRFAYEGKGHEMDIVNSEVSINPQFIIAHTANALTNTVTIRGGSAVTLGSNGLNLRYGRGNVLRVTGENTRFTGNSLFHMSGADTRLFVEDGALFSLTNSGLFRIGNSEIGAPSGGNEIIVSDATFHISGGSVRIGETGSNNHKLRAYGSTVTFDDTSVQIPNAGSGATLLLDDSTLNFANIAKTAYSMEFRGTDALFSANDSDVIFKAGTGNVSLNMTGAAGRMCFTNSVLDMSGTGGQFYIGSNDNLAGGNVAEFIDSQFTWRGAFRVGEQSRNNKLVASGHKTRLTATAGEPQIGASGAGTHSNRLEILNGAVFEHTNGNVVIATASNVRGNVILVKGRDPGTGLTNSLMRVSGTLSVGSQTNGNQDNSLEIADGGKVVLGTLTGGANFSSGILVFTDNATLVVSNNVNLRNTTFHVKGKSDVEILGEFQLRGSCALQCTLGKDGWNTLDFNTWMSNDSAVNGRRLVVDARAFQRNGGSGWVTISADKTPFGQFNLGMSTRRRFMPADVELIYEGADAYKHFYEDATEVRVYVPARGQTMIIVR